MVIRKQQYERQKVYVKYIFRLFVKSVQKAYENIANILVSVFKPEKPAFHGEHDGMDTICHRLRSSIVSTHIVL